VRKSSEIPHLRRIARKNAEEEGGRLSARAPRAVLSSRVRQGLGARKKRGRGRRTGELAKETCGGLGRSTESGSTLIQPTKMEKQEELSCAVRV
jgi:hypothetical protein